MEKNHYRLKGSVARDFLASVSSWLYSIWAQVFEAKKIFFSVRFAKLFKYFDESVL
jgi:hypothetical protein